MSFQYYARKSGHKIPVRYLVLHYTFARFQSTLCTGLFFLVRCDGRIAICADTATPIYRYIEFKGQFQVSTSYEMAIMGVMLCLGFTNKSEICRASWTREPINVPSSTPPPEAVDRARIAAKASKTTWRAELWRSAVLRRMRFARLFTVASSQPSSPDVIDRNGNRSRRTFGVGLSPCMKNSWSVLHLRSVSDHVCQVLVSYGHQDSG